MMLNLNPAEGLARLTFHEANILLENMQDQPQHQGLVSCLDNLLRNTEDPRLLSELEQLLSKVQRLSPQEYEQLRKDTLSGAILFPPDYILPGRAGEGPF